MRVTYEPKNQIKLICLFSWFSFAGYTHGWGPLSICVSLDFVINWLEELSKISLKWVFIYLFFVFAKARTFMGFSCICHKEGVFYFRFMEMMGGTSLKVIRSRFYLTPFLKNKKNGEQGEVKSEVFSFQFQHTVFSCSPH